jgi:hypothetical protein
MRALVCLLLVLPLWAKVDYATQVHPILQLRCAACHNGSRGQAGLSINTRAELLKGGTHGPSIIAGNGAGSLLLRRVNGEQMPLMPLGGEKLSAAELNILKTWIDEGAEFTAVTAPLRIPGFQLSLRDVKLKDPARHAIDQFLPAGQPLTDAEFARRAHFDLHGLPPTPEQLEKFLAHRDRSRLLDELLQDRGPYAAHWMSFWNDHLHNDEGVIFHGERKSITKWLQTALVENRPYDQFVRSLLNPREENGNPDGFLVGVTWRGVVNASQTPPMQAAQNSAQVFNGINLKCNACHDSFISHWKLKEAYGLAAFFATEPLELVRCDVAMGEKATAKFLFPELGEVAADASLAERRARVAELFTKVENGLFTRTIVNRVWKQLMGEGLTEPLDEMEAKSKQPELLDWLARDLIEHKYDLQHLMKRIMTSAAYQSRLARPRRLSAEQFTDTLSAISGEWKVQFTGAANSGFFAREWQFKSTPVTRALGRPQREMAVTARETDPTTLSTLELVNGSALAAHLRDASLRFTGQMPEWPANLADSGTLGGARRASFDVDLKGRRQLRMIVSDIGSFHPGRTKAVWNNLRFVGANGEIPFPEWSKAARLPAGVEWRSAALAPREKETLQKFDSLVTGASAEVLIDLTKIRAERLLCDLGNESDIATDSEVNPAVRFFLFEEAPRPGRLIRVQGGLPQPRPQVPATADALVRRVYRHALSREPLAEELQTARAMSVDAKGRLSPEGVEDFLWTILLSPEFQYLR